MQVVLLVEAFNAQLELVVGREDFSLFLYVFIKLNKSFGGV